MTWNHFVGLPHADLGRDRDGVDCYGLLRLVYAEALGVDLPSYTDAYGSCAEHAAIADAIAGAQASGPWTRTAIIKPYDALVFRIGARDRHVAVAVDRRRMLHVHARSRSVIVDRSDLMWRDRFAGAYRHEALR